MFVYGSNNVWYVIPKSNTSYAEMKTLILLARTLSIPVTLNRSGNTVAACSNAAEIESIAL